MSAKYILLANVASTWAMVGLIWFIQIVHYPLFAKVGAAEFVRYERLHQQLTTYVVLPLMFVELLSSVILVARRPDGVTQSTAIFGVVMVVAIWVLTFTVQVPQHGSLATQFDAAIHQKLVLGNWSRTILWSLRGVLSLWMLHVAMRR